MRLSRSEQDLTLTGSRPPSACSSGRPGSRSGRKGYAKVANTSVADEVLFSSSGSQLKLEEASFVAPWAKKDKRQILLWAPAPSSGRKSPVTTPQRQTNTNGNLAVAGKNPPKIKDSMLKTRQYKIVKKCPSFVDETLFGPKLEEPSFVAPWNVKSKRAVRPAHFDYSNYRDCPATDRGISVNGDTRLDLKHKSPAALRVHSARERSATRPTWKP